MGDEFMKKIILMVLCISLTMLCIACGDKEDASDNLEGPLTDIMAALYENAQLDEDFREGLDSFETMELTDDLEISILGTDEITYTEGVVSMPMMSSIAYQCVLLRVDEADVEFFKFRDTDFGLDGFWLVCFQSVLFLYFFEAVGLLLDCLVIDFFEQKFRLPQNSAGSYRLGGEHVPLQFAERENLSELVGSKWHERLGGDGDGRTDLCAYVHHGFHTCRIGLENFPWLAFLEVLVAEAGKAHGVLQSLAEVEVFEILC